MNCPYLLSDEPFVYGHARRVAGRLREQGHIADVAGGCVRDMVRGLTPKDYDIATDARPETVQALFPPRKMSAHISA